MTPVPKPAPFKVSQVFADALALHTHGRLAEAESLYSQVLAHRPDHFDALQMLSVVKLAKSQPAEALRLISEAMRLRKPSPQILLNYGMILHALNRIDEAVMFHPLNMDHIKQIVDIMLQRLNQQMGERGITLEIDDSAKEWLAQQGYDVAYGARPLRRAIQRHIEDPLSEEVLRGEFPQGGVVQIKLAGEELVFLAKQEDAVESLSDS